MNKKLFRTCPICGCDDGEILHTQKFSLSVENPLPKKYDVVCCSGCGFVFADSSVTQKEYDVYYEQLSKYEDEATATGTGSADYDAKRLHQTAQEIEKILPDRSIKILDVGAANGGLLLALKEEGYTHLVGLDPSLACVHRMQFQKLRAFVGGIFSMPRLDEKFDCIVLTHVLEHIYDVKGAIENLLSLLNEGGILYIEVPNASLYQKYFIVPFYYFDCEHINHFDEASIKNLLSIFGGTIIKSRSKEIPASKNQPYPALGVFYRKDNQNISQIIPNFTVKENILNHIQQSLKIEQNTQLEELENDKTPIIIWGAGQYTQRLLANTILNNCNIISFIDNDSKKQGMKLHNIEIKSKEILKNFNGPIIVASALHSQEIVKEIRAMSTQNSIIII